MTVAKAGKKTSKQKTASNKKTSRTNHAPKDFSREALLGFYQKMLLGRYLDEKMLILLKQSKSFFHIGTSGHEAAQLAMAAAMKPGYDWAYPYYRDQAFCLGYGMTTEDLMLCFLSKEEDPNSGGRQMPQHYGHKDLRIVTQSSPTGTQYLQAVGCAMGAVKEGTDEVVFVSSGEGATSEGDFHEALNWASREKLPVIFFIEDNKYAISVPVSQQTAGSSVNKMVSGYENLGRFEVDGTDFLETHKAAVDAVARARKGLGPSVIVAHVVRLLAHSSSDDQRKYRAAEDLERDRKSDPITKFESYLTDHGFADKAKLEAIRESTRKQVNEAADWADTRPFPQPSDAERHVWSEQTDTLEYETTEPSGKKVVVVDAINHALAEEMERNEKILIYGQDIQDDKGGVFTVTKGLTRKFGENRVFNSPLAESSIVGTAVGLAVRGWKPVVEIQFGDYIWTAMMQIRNEMATVRYRSNNKWKCPFVIRVPVGGYIHGALCHSQNIEAFFAHIPGLLIALPSNAADAKGLLKTAIRCDDPVLFLEHKGLYRQGFATSPEPDADYLLPFGKARIVKPGTDLTIVTYGMMVHKSLTAAKAIEEKHKVTIEIIDLRTIVPLDSDCIIDSARKTNKVLVVHEDSRFQGFGAEIAAQISEMAFEHLDGPVMRVGSKDTPVPYNWFLEEVILPQDHDIEAAVEKLIQY